MATANGSNVDCSFFEGTEKLLEVWFESKLHSDSADLCKIPRSFWDELLSRVNCQILSHTSVDGLHAYVLSESSMFISKNRFILKTCGQTTLLLAVELLLREAETQLGFDTVLDVFYSRKKFLRPELQPSIHRSFEEEVNHLDELFEDGAAYALGRINSDCWYLYTMNRDGVTEPDQTVELLMTELDPQIMSIFTMDRCKTGAEATKVSGIDKLLPGAVIDDYMFEPCGYSMNGILPKNGNTICKKARYFTIHVTPESGFSYVSFETNVEQKCYEQLFYRLLSTFNPGKVLLTLFANKTSYAKDSLKLFEKEEPFVGYKCTDTQFCRFKNYKLVYSNFTKAYI